jgi:hypothetical protein
LVKDLRTNSDDTKIYRGQSNSYKIKVKESPEDFIRRGITPDEIGFESWGLISSFNRYYNSWNYDFLTFLGQQFEYYNFKARYSNYNFKEINQLIYVHLLEKLYFLQHYSVPTCFLDFSHDPLIALYFAIASVRTSSTYRLVNGKPFIHPKGPYISIYEFNHREISKLLKVKDVENDFSSEMYGQYKIGHFHLGFDIQPSLKCQLDSLNENMKLQKGCFILFDNNGKNTSLNKFIESELTEIKPQSPLIREYRLGYNEIFFEYDFEDLKDVSLFGFLNSNKISGRYLFNDIQDLKFDLNFFHQ